MKVSHQGTSVEGTIDEWKKILGDVFRPLKRLWRYSLSLLLQRRLPDWVVKCRQRDGWAQKSDAKALNVGKRYLRLARFRVVPHTEFWRAGIIIGNDKYSPGKVVDSENAITCHIGSSELEDAVKVWVYDEQHPRRNPYKVNVPTQSETEFDMKAEVNDKNFLTFTVAGQSVYVRLLF